MVNIDRIVAGCKVQLEIKERSHDRQHAQEKIKKFFDQIRPIAFTNLTDKANQNDPYKKH
jgi:hypothetical protein